MIKAQNILLKDSLKFDRKLLKVPVKECGERMICLPGTTFYLRESVASSLTKVMVELGEKGHIVVVKSAYRSLAEQKTRFLKRVKDVALKNPSLPKRKVLEMANIYTAGVPILGAHTAGAAIDVVLAGTDMGSVYPQACLEAKTTYYKLRAEIKKNRMILCSAMEKHGFVNYPFEWWHFSQGDVCAAYLKHQLTAIYAPVDFDLKTESFSYSPNIEYYSYFCVSHN